ncbi:hypothetical protein [Reyranella sp.]|uniref:hypothetical protein n=1 Tax=Reyranella sp. TaxID=1929291 RepID=UPI003BAD9452
MASFAAVLEPLKNLGFMDYGRAPSADVLLASGLRPYPREPFEALAFRLSSRPRHILLNKVVTRDGLAEVPYQIRNAYEVPAAPQTPGYEILDEWTIDQLAHRIQNASQTRPLHLSRVRRAAQRLGRVRRLERHLLRTVPSRSIGVQ